jgi:hypothetical protein
LALNPEGVIVGFSRSGKADHFIVFNSDRGSGFAPNDRFRVSDAGSTTSAAGENCIFSSCATFGTTSDKCNIAGAFRVYWFD